MPDYSKSVIYKIQHNEDETLCYIGSTCNFRNRKYHHKNTYHNENDTNYNLKVYQMIRDNGGWDSFKCVIVEEYPCETRQQLNIKEEEYRERMKANMNTRKAFSDNKEYQKKYYDDNIDKKKEYKKKYYDEKKDKYKEYYDNNKDKINKQTTQYYHENKKNGKINKNKK